LTIQASSSVMLSSSETVEKPDFESSVLLRNPNFLVCSIG
jgi:hypothetical protein